MNTIKELITTYNFTPVEVSEILTTHNITPEDLYTLLTDYGYTSTTIQYFSTDCIPDMQSTITKYKDNTKPVSTNVIRLACEQCNIPHVTSLKYVFLVTEASETNGSNVKYIKHIPRELQAIKLYNERLYNAILQITTVAGSL